MTSSNVAAKRGAPCCAFLLGLLACGGRGSASPKMAAFSPADFEGCFSNGATDAWKPRPGSQVSVLATDSTDFPTAGLASSGENLLGYDRADGRVMVWAESGAPLLGFGRLGRGPGELAPAGATRVFPTPDPVWVSALADTIAVFDGNDVHLYDSAGGFLSRMRPLSEAISGAWPVGGRIRRVPGGVVIGIETRVGVDRRRKDQPRPFQLWLIETESASVRAGIELDPLPQFPRGGLYHGVSEASPVWDLASDCVVISDGSTPRLFVGRMGRTGLDTIPIPLPAATPDVEGEADAAKALAQMGDRGTLPAPSMPRRVAGMVVDPAGWIWLLPVQDAGDRYLQVIRVALAGSRVERDSVPVFPAVFAQSPGYFGITARDSSGIRRLVKVAASPAAP